MAACLPMNINHHYVCMEIAKTPAEQKQGLSGRKAIKDNYAMLFDMRMLGFNYRAFWAMQGMEFPIDIIWIKDKTIVTINYSINPCKEKNLLNCQLFGGFPVDYVIETKAGNANTWGLYINQKINIKVAK